MHLVSLLLLLLAASQHALGLQKVLLFTATAGYRHSSIPNAIDIIERLGSGDISLPSALAPDSVRAARWETEASEDGSLFEEDGYLKQFDAVIFALTTDVDPPGKGTVLSREGARKFAQYIQNGGSFAGIHSASNTLYAHPWYGRLVGAFFDHHAPLREMEVKRMTAPHPSVARWPGTLMIEEEELYHFRTDPRSLPSRATVLLSSSGRAALPLAWYREGKLLDVPFGRQLGGGLDDVDGPRGGPGRSFFTSLGHAESTWDMDEFRAHIAGGISWVLQRRSLDNNTGSENIVVRPWIDAKVDSSRQAPHASYLALAVPLIAASVFLAIR